MPQTCQNPEEKKLNNTLNPSHHTLNYLFFHTFFFFLSMKSSEIDVSTNKNLKGLPEAMYQYLSTNTKVPILKYRMKQPVANKQM